MGFDIIPSVANGGWYVLNGQLMLAPMPLYHWLVYLGHPVLEDRPREEPEFEIAPSPVQGGDLVEHYLGIFIRAVFIENMALTFFLGMCTFIAISKNLHGLWLGCCGDRRAGHYRAGKQSDF